MTIRHFATVLVTALLWGLPANAQSAADLLQKGIYAQDTLGDLDGAIKSYRQVLTTYPTNKQTAAQAQYQLVLCMRQKGDNAAASRELDALERNYPDQVDLIAKARTLLPIVPTLLPAPWPDGEAFQLNIKRDGAFTGEYLSYFISPNTYPVRGPAVVPGPFGNSPGPTPDQLAMHSMLVTTGSKRSVWVAVERETMQVLDRPNLRSNDVVGDPTAATFAGPAIDLEPLVYRMRRLPLAVGYKATITTQPFVLGEASHQVELTVTGTETVQVVAGKFNCYKVTAGALGQTFWIGVDGARPLVKIQFAKAEAELVKVWSGSLMDTSLAFLKTAGWSIENARPGTGPGGSATAVAPRSKSISWDQKQLNVQVEGVYTASGNITQALRQTMENKVSEIKGYQHVSSVLVRPDSVQTRLIGGQQALICVINYETHSMSEGMPVTTDERRYFAWIRTESTGLEFEYSGHNDNDVAVIRFLFEPVLATARIP